MSSVWKFPLPSINHGAAHAGGDAGHACLSWDVDYVRRRLGVYAGEQVEGGRHRVGLATADVRLRLHDRVGAGARQAPTRSTRRLPAR